jgi:hypothetical protein
MGDIGAVYDWPTRYKKTAAHPDRDGGGRKRLVAFTAQNEGWGNLCALGQAVSEAVHLCFGDEMRGRNATDRRQKTVRLVPASAG